MIAIINKCGPVDGVCTYTVRINRDVVTEFQHDRRKGLARCLRDAARAVDAADEENAKNIDDLISVYQKRLLGMLE